MTLRRSLLSTLLVVAACGGDDGGNNNPQPDAPPGATCLPTVGEITSYPGTYSGTVNGGGADLTAPENSCATQTGDAWYDPTGEDVVIHLTNLTAGQTYGVRLTTEEDLGFYVTSSCPSMAGAVTGCLNFTDQSLGDESGAFVAAGTEHWLVIDTPDTPMTGAFQVEVIPAECTAETEATACGAAAPYCVDFTCVQCLSSFDCAAGTPVCDATNTCTTGTTACTGDDADDATQNGNDGPSVATTLTAPTAQTPTTVSKAICSSPGSEQDWYKVTLPAGNLGIEVTWPGAPHDLDVYLLAADGSVEASGTTDGTTNEAFRANGLAAGDYYVAVLQYAPAATAAAVAYNLTLRVPSCDTDFGCTNQAAPVCGPSGVCGNGPSACVSDDAGDNSAGDDGPAAARLLVTGVAQTGSICSSPTSEADWYKINVVNAQGLDVALSWTGTDDLDPVVLDANGTTLGLSFWKNPENVKLTHLATGTYYIQVSKFTSSPSTAVTAYSLTATVTAVDLCTADTDCDDEFRTQILRGSCNTGTGVCSFIPAGARAAGERCDSGNDCTSGDCSYIAFDADGAESVCTRDCTTTADCSTLGAGFTCTGFSSGNFCVPACTTNLECGANTQSDTLDTNEPWDYLTCTVATGVCAL